MFLLFGQKGALMVLDMCVKFGVWEKSGSRDMGPLVTPKRLFRLFLEKHPTYFEVFSPVGGRYGTKSWCKIWDPAEFRFSRYGAIGTPKRL